MPVYAVDVVIPIEIYADSEDEAIKLAKNKIIFERKDLVMSMLEVKDKPEEISFF